MYDPEQGQRSGGRADPHLEGRREAASSGWAGGVARPDEAASKDGLTLPSVPQSVAQIRRYAVGTCRSRGFDGDYDTLELLVSEVATNALIHGDGQV